MLDDSPINIVLELDRNIILGVAFFEIAEVRHAMEEGEVVDDGVEIEVVILSETRDLHFPHPYGGVAAEDQHSLGLVGMVPEILHGILHGHIQLPYITPAEVVLLPDEGQH